MSPKTTRQIGKKIRIAVAQLNPIVGDIESNLAKARVARAQAVKQNADLIIFPPYFISGYPLLDLCSKQSFVDKCQWAVDELKRDTADGKAAILLSYIPYCVDDYPPDEPGVEYLLDNGQECRGDDMGILDMRGVALRPFVPWRVDSSNWKKILDKTQFAIDVFSFPYREERLKRKFEVARNYMAESGKPFIHVNPVGGQDEWVFDGGSFALQPNGETAFQMPHFAESLSVSEWEKTISGWECRDGEMHEVYEGTAANYHACMIGLRDYVNKNGFDKVLLGLSGGVDSALCAALAVDALGADRVQTVMLPYHYTSAKSLADAQDCANRLGCAYQTIPIAEPVEAFLDVLKPAFGDAPADVTEENLQSRARGVILMALSNKFGALLLTTGNKSEAAVGYATLYGDMCGGFNPLKDLYKRDVYALCNWRNNNMPKGGLGARGQVIPQNILDRAPSAELRPDQKDEDSLPPYPVLDAILHGLIEEKSTVAEIVAKGYDRKVIERIEDLLYRGEFKRQQAAPGVTISSRSFGEDWHMPITHRFRDRMN